MIATLLADPHTNIAASKESKNNLERKWCDAKEVQLDISSSLLAHSSLRGNAGRMPSRNRSWATMAFLTPLLSKHKKRYAAFFGGHKNHEPVEFLIQSPVSCLSSRPIEPTQGILYDRDSEIATKPFGSGELAYRTEIEVMMLVH